MLSVKYFETTDTPHLVQEIGSEVQDDRIKMVSAIGGVAGVARSFTLAGEEPGGGQPVQPLVEKKDSLEVTLTLPVTINAYSARDGHWRPLPRNQGWWYKLVLSGTSPDKNLAPSAPPWNSSIQTDAFFKKYALDSGDSTAAFPFSACRRASLHLKHNASAAGPGMDVSDDVTFDLMVADPDYIETLALPPKGKIKMHTVCGADLLTESATVINAWGILEEMMKQVKAVKDQQKGKQESNE
jgi:hypothetical protein